MRPTAIAGALLGGAALVLLSPAAAFAEPPVDFAGAYVVDEAGVLGGTSGIESALDDLYDRAEVSLFVVYVSTFDDPSDPGLWADTTAALSGLGPDDVLLAVAVDDRQYQLNDQLLFDDQYDRVATRIETELRANDWEGAALEAADAIGDELVGDQPAPAPSPEGSGGGIPILPILGGVAVVGVGAWGVSKLVKRRRGGGAVASGPVEKLDQKGLDQRAGGLLVALDDALQTNEQELGFAQAQFGDKATKEFATALAAAKAKVAEAFAIRQRLDDAVPETPAEKRDLTTQIIRLCEEASASLEQQSTAFEQLRQLEANAPQVLEQVAAAHAALPGRIEAAEATVKALREQFGAAAVGTVADGMPQARELVAFAGTALGEARTALAASQSSEAAVAVRGAQQAVGQAERTLAAVDKLKTELPGLVERLAAATADVKADVAEARAGLPKAPAEVADPLRRAADEAERVLATTGDRDPATAIGDIERVAAPLHEELGKLRDAKAQAERARAQLSRVTAEGESSVAAARDYIATRRGAVGATARTRLAEAERQLLEARRLTASDPVSALRFAQQAVALATSAMQTAQSEVMAFDGGSTYGSGSSGYGGAALGGILDGIFSGGSSSSGWTSGGGSGWSSGSSSSRPRPRPRPSSSSGGGSASRPRPSGGRRSRGGRF